MYYKAFVSKCKVRLSFSSVPVYNILMKIRDFTIPELNRFRALCNFTEDELLYFNLRSKDKSNIQIALEMNISEAQVSKLAKRVKDKMKRVI